MGIIPDGWLRKHPYLNRAEAAVFKQLRESGQFSIFRTAPCQRSGCANLVPRGKLYCCRECFSVATAAPEDKDPEDGEEHQHDPDHPPASPRR